MLDFPGGPVVKTSSTAVGSGSIPGQGTKIPHAMHCGQKKKKKREKRYVYIISKNPFILGKVEELRHQFNPWVGKIHWRRKW